MKKGDPVTVGKVKGTVLAVKDGKVHVRFGEFVAAWYPIKEVKAV